jgi:hypothetical protein
LATVSGTRPFCPFRPFFRAQPCARKSCRPFCQFRPNRTRATTFKKDRPEGPIHLKRTGRKAIMFKKDC